MATTGRYVLKGRKGLFYFQDGVDAQGRTSHEGTQLLGYDSAGLPQGTFGSSSAPITKTATGNLFNFYQTNSVTSGDVRNVYSKLTLTGATGVSGEAGRFYTLASGKPTAMHGIHATAEISGGTGVAGMAAGLRGTVASATGLTLNAGTYAPLRLDSSLKSALNAAAASWIYMEDLESSKIGLFFNGAVVDTSSMYVASGTSAGSAGDTTKCNAQRVLTCRVNGALVYIPVFTQNS